MARADTPPNLALVAAIRVIVARNVVLIGLTLLISLVFLWLGPDGILVLIVPILVFAGLWLVMFGLKDRADYQAVQKTGPPQPGQWTAVCGTVRALEKTEDDILACRFQLFDEERGIRNETGGTRSKNFRCRYDGFFLVPMGIETKNGTIPLAGFPDLIHLDKTPLPNGLLVRAKAAAYDCPKWLPMPLAREIILSGIGDRAQTCLHYGKEGEASQGTIRSWMLRPGDQVCIFGRWNDGALTSSKDRPRGLPVYQGDAETVRAKLSGDSSAFLILGTVFLVIALGLAIWSLL